MNKSSSGSNTTNSNSLHGNYDHTEGVVTAEGASSDDVPKGHSGYSPSPPLHQVNSPYLPEKDEDFQQHAGLTNKVCRRLMEKTGEVHFDCDVPNPWRPLIPPLAGD